MFVPGLLDAYLEHKATLINGIRTGAADDKLVFIRAPQMIERYLGETPVLEQATSYNTPACCPRKRFTGASSSSSPTAAGIRSAGCVLLAPQGRADLVHVTEDFFVGLPDAGLVVGEALVTAEAFHHLFGFL